MLLGLLELFLFKPFVKDYSSKKVLNDYPTHEHTSDNEVSSGMFDYTVFVTTYTLFLVPLSERESSEGPRKWQETRKQKRPT